MIYWIEDGTRRHNVLSDLNFAIARRFAQEKIELPYPHTVVLLPEKSEGASADLAVRPKTDA